jgi:transcriptional regulator with XRE-family HTH domain
MAAQRIKELKPAPAADAPRQHSMRRQRKHAEPDIGTRIKALAVLRGFSLRELAAVTGLKYDRVRNIVYGVVQEIHSHELQLVTAALDSNIDWLIKGRGDPLYSKVKPAPAPRPASADPRDAYYDYIRDPEHPITKRVYESMEREFKERKRS